MRILIVDDDETLRHLLRLTLEEAGMELFEAENGDQAIEMYKDVMPDVVLVDIMMPGELDGYQVCSAIKSEENSDKVRVVIVSARGQKKDIEKGKQVGADHYLVKPYHPNELLQLVKSFAPADGADYTGYT